ncbi:hypothetical protein C8Q80DRAFT_1346053 [Daedaleopsis nitida]|nr:hypothetical protein C8Q80DRAFT_1346053 [Daedaleopsis nitida]
MSDLQNTLQSNTNYTLPASLARQLDDLIGELSNLLSFETSAYIPMVTHQVIEVLLSTVVFGIYSILALMSVYILCRRSQKGCKPAPKVVMLLVVTAIYVSTTVYWVTAVYEMFHELRLLLNGCLFGAATVEHVINTFSLVYPEARGTAYYSPTNTTAVDMDTWWRRPMQDCVGTASLTINMALGDAIVWWRAWVLWKGSRPVRALCCILVSATFITGVVATTHGCKPSDFALALGWKDAVTLSAGSLYIGDQWGLASSILSLVTNMTATSLIAYKAWHHRRLLRQNLRMGSAGTWAEKTLILLVESGTLYCVFWIPVVTYQLCTNTSGSDVSEAQAKLAFGFYYVIAGCLIPLIPYGDMDTSPRPQGIYPTLIILLVALDKSHCDSSFTESSSKSPFHLALPPRVRLPRARRGTLDEVISISHWHGPRANDFATTNEGADYHLATKRPGSAFTVDSDTKSGPVAPSAGSQVFDIA